MSILNILFGTRAPGSAVIGGFEMDVTLEELHDRAAQVTDAPIETGTAVQDHVYLEPARVRVQGFVSSAPARVLPLADAGPARVVDAFLELERLHEARELLTLVTGYKVYEDMVLTTLSMPRTRQVGLQFTAEFVQITTVDIEVIPADPEVADAAAERVDAGRQTAREAGETTQQRSSLLIDLLGLGGDT